MLCLLVIGILASDGYSQKEIKLQADYAYKKLGYSSSADLYEQVGASRLNTAAKARLGDSYRLNGDTEAAEHWYAQAVAETPDAEDILHYAQMLQSNGKCEEAITYYNEYLEVEEEEVITPRATIKDCSELDFRAKSNTRVTNMTALNSAHLDFSPIPYKGGIVFTSTRGREKQKMIDQWTNDNFSDLFYAEKNGNGQFKAPVVFEGRINEKFHDGTATFDKSGTRMYFSRNSEGKNSKEVNDLKIYSADLIDGIWTNIKALSFNDQEFATCHPALSPDGRYLYFSSNRPGGIGGMDLYVVIKRGSGWSTPRNLGATVNTPSNEIFPFTNKKDKIFFASNGHQGMGGLDIYTVEKSNGDWLPVENLGAPFNSIKDDFGFSQMNNGKEGYLSSNRGDGVGGDDIYQWQSDEMISSSMDNTNIIAVIDEATGARVPAAMVTITEGVVNQIEGVMEKEATSAAMISFLTDNKGMVSPSFAAGQTYTISVNKPGYSNYRKVVTAYELLKAREWMVAIAKRDGVVLDGSVVNKKYDHSIPNAVVTLFNYCTGEKEKALTDSDGKFSFFLDCKCDYEILGEKERFNADKKTISTIDINCEDTHPITTTLLLNIGSAPTTTSSTSRSVPINGSSTPVVSTPVAAPTRVVSTPIASPPTIVSAPVATPAHTPINKSTVVIKNLSDLSIDNLDLSIGNIITLDNLYYDYDKFFIRPDAAKELDRIVLLMKKYTTLELELSSHTDARGRKGYNQTLSQKRAEVAINYIISKGISRHRLTARGLGEEQLRNHCADDTYCSEEEHQENRRTEVRVLKR